MNRMHTALLRFQALSARERLLALLAAIIALTGLLDTIWLGPQRQTIRELTQQFEQHQSERNTMAEVLSGPVHAVPDADTAERDDLRLRVARAEAALGPSARLARLSDVLRSLLAARSGLVLVSLKTLAPQEIAKAPAPRAPQNSPVGVASQAPAPALYQHGVEVTVRGTYPALLAYLENLQSQPKQIFWSKVQLDVQTYPQALLLLKLYTVSDRPLPH